MATLERLSGTSGHQQLGFGQAFLSIPGQIRTILSARMVIAGRRTPEMPLIVVLGWILIAFSLVQTFFFAHWVRSRPQYADLAGPAVVPALLAMFAIGIPATWRLLSERRWFALLHTQPLSPSAVLACLLLERWARVGTSALFMGAYIWGMHSRGLGASAVAVCCVIAASSLTLGTLQVITALIVRVTSGHAVLKAILAAILVAVLLCPFIAGSRQASPGDHVLKTVLQQIDSHPLMHVAGLTDIAALGRIDIEWHGRLVIMGRVLLRVLVCSLAMTLLLGRCPERLTQAAGNVRSRMLTLATWPINRLMRTSRTGWITQGCLEFLLLLRQGNVMVTLCALGGLLALAFARSLPGGNLTPASLMPLVGLIIGFEIGADGLVEILYRRSPYRLYRCCGADPGDYAAGLAVMTACVSTLVVLACLPILIGEQSLSACASAALGAVVLGVCEAALATLISLYLHPIVPHLGIIGKIKSGLILILSAWLVMLMFSSFMPLPIILVVLFWWIKKKSLGDFLWRRIWNADSL